ncbi:MAG: Citrate synthase (si), partial [uncultured Rubrobacteraceae bacterium]
GRYWRHFRCGVGWRRRGAHPHQRRGRRGRGPDPGGSPGGGAGGPRDLRGGRLPPPQRQVARRGGARGVQGGARRAAGSAGGHVKPPEGGRRARGCGDGRAADGGGLPEPRRFRRCGARPRSQVPRDLGRLPPAAERRRARPARPGAGTRRQLSVHALGREAGRGVREGAGDLPQYRLRPRHERLDLRGARHRRHPLRPHLGRRRGRRRPQGAAARRGAGASARRGVRDRVGRERRARPAREARARGAAHGVRAQDLPRPRPPRRRAGSGRRTPLRHRRGRGPLRPCPRGGENGAPPPRRAQAWPQPPDQRRVLHGPSPARPRPPRGPLHPHLRRRPGRRLDRPLPRAANRGPAHTPAVRVRRGRGPPLDAAHSTHI